MEFVKMNVNNHVRVKLTEKGYKVLRAFHEKWSPQHPYEPPAADEEGWTTFQLHDLMTKFGDALYCGALIPFLMNILIEVQTP